MKYSILSLLSNAWSHNKNWPRVWRSPELQSHYDVIIIGGGGHGLATAYYLAKEHGVRKIAVEVVRVPAVARAAEGQLAGPPSVLSVLEYGQSLPDLQCWQSP